MAKDTFTAPDLTAFTRLDELGLVAVGQQIGETATLLSCRVAASEQDKFCRQCGAAGVARGTVVRRLAHEPNGWRPTTLAVRIRRFRCAYCRRVWQQDTSRAAAARAKISRAGVRWALEGLVVNHMSVAALAKSLAVAWDTANDAILSEGHQLLINDEARFTGVRVIGVDEHVWRHTRGGGKYVTVIIDLTPVRAGTGTSRLLDMIPGRSKAVFKDWLTRRPQPWRDNIEIVAMDGFTGYKTAASEELPAAQTVMDPFHVVRLAGNALDECRRRIQQEIHGRRGRTGDRLYQYRRTLQTGADLITDQQAERLTELFALPDHAPVEATWGVYQNMITAYRNPNRKLGRYVLETVIKQISSAIPRGLPELTTLGRTLKRRADDILAYFDHPGSSNGPTEATNGRLEHLRGTALGFRNLNHYIARALLECGGFRPALHPQIG